MKKHNEPSKEWIELKDKFENLCDEQAKLYRKDFEIVYKALFNMHKEQQEIYKTQYWNIGCDLPDKADTAKIKDALKISGFSKDEAFCNDFIRYCNVVIEGKKHMQKGTLLNLNQEVERYNANNKSDKSTKWQFCPICIIAPKELHSFVEDRMSSDAISGKGLFANVTDISKEYDLDAFLMIDAFDLQGSLIEFKDNLEAHRVIGNKGFLNEEFTYFLFATVSSLAKHIAANTDRPSGTKNHIIDTLKELDRLPVWGLFFQILILQGLCTWLEGLDITEQDRGFKAAQSLYDWIFERLMEKEIYFCYTPYSDNDKKLLKPFCDYLYSTYAGKTIQKLLHERITDVGMLDNMPKELKDPEIMQRMNVAKEWGLLDENYQPTDKITTKAQKAYLADVLIPEGRRKTWKPFEEWWWCDNFAKRRKEADLYGKVRDGDKIEELERYFIRKNTKLKS